MTLLLISCGPVEESVVSTRQSELAIDERCHVQRSRRPAASRTISRPGRRSSRQHSRARGPPAGSATRDGRRLYPCARRPGRGAATPACTAGGGLELPRIAPRRRLVAASSRSRQSELSLALGQAASTLLRIDASTRRCGVPASPRGRGTPASPRRLLSHVQSGPAAVEAGRRARREGAAPADRGARSVLPSRHHDLGGRGRRRRATVGHQVGDREIHLVPDGGDDRERRDAAIARASRSLIERPLLQPIPAATEDHHFEPGTRGVQPGRRRRLRRPRSRPAPAPAGSRGAPWDGGARAP